MRESPYINMQNSLQYTAVHAGVQILLTAVAPREPGPRGRGGSPLAHSAGSWVRAPGDEPGRTGGVERRGQSDTCGHTLTPRGRDWGSLLQKPTVFCVADDMRFLLKVFNNTEDHRDAAVALELHGEGRTRALYCKEESTVAYKETALADTIPGDSHESIFYLRRIQDNTFTLESSKYKGSYLFCYQDGPCYKLILKKMTDEVDEGQHVTIESCSDEDP
nr:PREDICTED: uncharacterized protein LOC107075709 isoform X1 [Lepisosteus oculatus]